ncbi:MAG: zinc ribbon domain-containing protein [Verrucomicrobiae bacterium]|nr:zinc ribbon domain-containing protein [Verrucomicrobiae bacterium]
MPTYQYFCEKCKKNFDYFQSMKDKPLTHCPQTECRQKKWGKGKVKRLLSGGAGFIFKGSGFYITDYRSENYKSAAKKESEAAKPNSEKKSSETKKKDSAKKD